MTPVGYTSDHPVATDGSGPSWVASIVNAIGQSGGCDGGAGYWKNTAIIVLWDDWGGFYDHEAPDFAAGPQGDYENGFRVPMIFVSAYTTKNFINNNRLTFGTIFRFVQRNFGLKIGGLGYIDSRSKYDLFGMFDLRRSPRQFVKIPAPLGPGDFLNDKRPPTPPDFD